MPTHVIQNNQDAIDELMDIAHAVQRNLNNEATNGSLPIQTRQAASNAMARVEEARAALRLARDEVDRMRVPKPSKVHAIHEPERARVL
jgi:hypothetical protein